MFFKSCYACYYTGNQLSRNALAYVDQCLSQSGHNNCLGQMNRVHHEYIYQYMIIS